LIYLCSFDLSDVAKRSLHAAPIGAAIRQRFGKTVP
jgi:hypothetical protein